MMNHFDVLPNLKYAYFSPTSIQFLNALAKSPIMFEVNNTPIRVSTGLGFEVSNWCVLVAFNTGEDEFSLCLPRDLFIDITADFQSAQTWPLELLSIRVQYFLEPVMHLFEQAFKKELVIDNVSIHSQASLSHRGEVSHLNLQVRDALYSFALEADDSILSQFLSRLNASQRIKPVKQSIDYVLPVKLSIGFTLLTLNRIKKINLHDIILVERENFKNGVYRLMCADQWLEASSIDLKMFSIIKKLDGIAMKQESEKNLIETSEIELNVDFVCGQKNISISELDAVNPGYVFELNQDISSLVTIEVNGAKIGEGRLVEVDNRLGVQVVALAKGRVITDNSEMITEEKVASV
ncbi:MAG: type III secretion system YscQ/HrcQ family protein [Oceanicoccus sp.]|jgi:type III secretion system YscQ/HrcQ family protein